VSLTSAAGRPLRRRLTFRLAAALCLGAAAILVAAGMWNVSLQREHMTELVRASADRGADIILSSTRAAMLDNRPAEVRRILDTIGAQPGIELIRIFDKQGRIGASTRAGEIGALVDTDAEQCYGCHRAGRPLERLEGVDRMRIFTNGGGRRVLSVILPIRNAPDCSSAACHVHDPAKQVLGVLDYHMSLAAVDERIDASEKQMAVGLGATVGAVLVLAGLLTWFLVLRPVRRFAAATERVRRGDLAASVDVSSGDELGDLAGSWNQMVEELSRARRDLETWSRTLEIRVEEATKELDAAHRRMLVVEKMASLGKLAAVVAHEINNPLAGIATYAKLLRRRLERRGGAEDPETAKALELVESEAIRCGGIVRNLLLFSRTPGSRFVEEPLAPLLERCAALVRHQAELQDVTIRVECAADLPKVMCDASQVQQIVLALTMNALEATGKGGAVTLRAARDDGRGGVKIAVADTGCGIAAADLPHIFEPFFTTKSEGKGVGLGLAVVYGIVERHHGQIDVDTAPGAGTSFTVRLPLVQPARRAPEGAVP
jgi:two-component system NtrC family sensor kinase